jgi:Protein of unknown function (DUF2844)
MRSAFLSGLLDVSAGILLFVIWATLPAFAALGEDVSSVAADQARLKASVRMLPRQHYSVQEMQTPSGTTVRQFVSPSGTVFAVSWEGSAPDLQQLLGTYFEEFESAVASEPSRRRRGIHLDDGELVLDTGGHMRFVAGRAFLRSKLPTQVTSDDIR